MEMAMMNKKIAIITGASSGMGKEFAIQIARRYNRIEEIWVIARRKQALCELKKLIPNKKVRVLALDLTKEEDLLSYRKLLFHEQPRVRILVNAAGYGKIGSIEEIGIEDSVGMVDLNCRSLVYITEATLPYMNTPSNIIQLASSAAFLPQPEFAVYAASKSFVHSYARALRREVSNRSITVTSVCPGPVDTEFFDIAEEKHKMKLYKKFTLVKKEKVVALALQDARNRKEVSVYGLPMKLYRILARVFPASLILRFI